MTHPGPDNQANHVHDAPGGPVNGAEDTGWMDARALLGRKVADAHGAVFHVVGLSFDKINGLLVVDLLGSDAAGNPDPHGEVGVPHLAGWTLL